MGALPLSYRFKVLWPDSGSVFWYHSWLFAQGSVLAVPGMEPRLVAVGLCFVTIVSIYYVQIRNRGERGAATIDDTRAALDVGLNLWARITGH